MQNNFIEIIEPIPKLNSKKCKIISFILRVFLQFFTYIIGVVTIFLYDYFIAILVLVLSFIVMGIIRSKLRNSVIPPKQMEFQYDDKSIADWYTAKVLCF